MYVTILLIKIELRVWLKLNRLLFGLIISFLVFLDLTHYFISDYSKMHPNIGSIENISVNSKLYHAVCQEGFI